MNTIVPASRNIDYQRASLPEPSRLMGGRASGVKTPALVLAVFLVLAAAGCALPPRAYEKHHAPGTQQKHQKLKHKVQKQRPVDAGTQQYYYDLGLQQYSSEHYRAARTSFQQVVDNGPDTLLGSKAQENIKKIDRILKTLNEIESK